MSYVRQDAVARRDTLQLKQYYNDVTLYADSPVAKLLIDTLKLPYSNVVCNLDPLKTYHSELWALPKIFVYAQQEKPFLHIDGDVFIWKAFSDELLQNKLIAQNIEAATEYYENIMQSLERELKYFPTEILNERKKGNPILAYNAGIFGGSDTNYFKEFSIKAFEFVDKNITHLNKINVTNFNIFFEQYLFYCMVKNDNRNVAVLIDKVIGDNEYVGFADFGEVPHNNQYLHLLGKYKRHELACKLMANRLRNDYPEYYYRIISLYKNSSLSLFKDYYFGLTEYSETALIEYSNNTKNEANCLTTNETLTNSPIISNNNFAIIALQNAIIAVKQNHNVLLNIEDYPEQVKDLKKFSLEVIAIVNNKFSKINREFLYYRDLKATKYSQFLFEDFLNINSKHLVADDKYIILTCKYDWATINENEPIFIMKIAEQLHVEPLPIHIAIIPECDQIGYSFANVDELDLQILELLKEEKTINKFFSELKLFFDEEDLKESTNEFEKLIFGRIKILLQHKIIRAVMP